jgi:hypothetical protein
MVDFTEQKSLSQDEVRDRVLCGLRKGHRTVRELGQAFRIPVAVISECLTFLKWANCVNEKIETAFGSYWRNARSESCFYLTKKGRELAANDSQWSGARRSIRRRLCRRL